MKDYIARTFFILIVVCLVSQFAFAGDPIAVSSDRVSDDTKPIDELRQDTTNIKLYNPITKEMTIKDGTFQDIAKVKLLTPQNNYVGAGYQKVAEFEVDAKQTYADFIDSMYFYDIKKNFAAVKRGYDLRVKVDYQQVVQTVTEICDEDAVAKRVEENKGTTDGLDFSDICTKKYGERTDNLTRYDLLTEKSFATEKKIISIWTNVEIGDKVEWIPSIFGVIGSEWATWDYSLNTGLISYFKMDTNSGGTTTPDAVGANNATIGGTYTTQKPGLINNGFQFFDAGTSKLTIANESNFDYMTTSTPTWSMSYWFKANSLGTGVQFAKQNTASTAGVIINSDNATNWNPRVVFRSGTSDYNTYACDNKIANGTDGNWHHIAFAINGLGSVTCYLDSNKGTTTRTKSGTLNASSMSNNIAATMGKYQGTGNGDQDLIYDEWGFWNRVLTDSEVANLYNNRAGQPYLPIVPFKIDLNVYRTGTSTHLSAVDMDCNVNAFDKNNQTSPFSTIDGNAGTSLSCAFVRAGYDTNTQTLYFDANKTQVVYLADTTAPSVGATTTSGFTIVGSTISGTGTIVGGTATDSGSGIDTSSCEYTSDNGANWYAATWDTDHCKKTGFQILSSGTYTFNTRVKDIATNQGTGTATSSYTGTIPSPITSISGCGVGWNNSTQTITLDCNGNGYNCIDTNYRLNTGTWIKYSVPFTVGSSVDGNYKIEYFSNSNYPATELTKTSYCAVDKTAPTIGTITLSGFTIIGDVISGTGNIYASITDSNSGVNVSQCEYTDNNGANWYAADGNTTTCYKTGITTSDRNYIFNIRGKDNAGNTGTGTATQNYQSDSTPPVTTVTITPFNDTNKVSVHIDCVDAGTGCALIQYSIDGNGTWFTYTTDFNYVGRGHHTIDHNSQDGIGNKETKKTSDLNMPVFLTIKYPKDIQTLLNLSEKWEVISTGGVQINRTDLNTDLNVYVAADTITTFYFVDVNGNYLTNSYTRTYYGDSNNGTTDTLQPYLYALNTSLSAIINAVNARTNLAVPDVTVKTYATLVGIGYTMIGQVTTDSKGQAIQQFLTGNTYTLEVYYGGDLIKTYTINATGSTIVIALDFNAGVVTPTPSGYSVAFTPIGNGLVKLNVGNQIFTQKVYNPKGEDVNYTSTISVNGVVISTLNETDNTDSNFTFTHTIGWNQITTGEVVSRITMTINGTTYTKQQTYIVNDSFGTNYNILTGLSEGLRADCGCDTNAGTICVPLLVIGLLITIGFAIYASMLMGQFGSQTTAIIAAILMIVFTYLSWIPVMLTAACILVGLAFIISERR